MYSTFYDFMGFDEAHNREARSRYLRYFVGKRRVLELGCGRGEFLALLEENGHEALGVDVDAGMVAHARARGHSIEQGDVVEYLERTEERFDGVFSAHLVEHLDAPMVQRLLAGAYRVLRPGGVACVATPNPGSLPTTLHEFWWDATHVRMYDLPLLRYLFEQAGFEPVEAGVNELNWGGAPVDLSTLDPDDAGMPPPQPPAAVPSTGASARLRARFNQEVAGSAAYRQVLDELHRMHLRVLHLEDRLRRLEGNVKQFLEEVYPPNEIFVAGRRPETSDEAAP